MRQVIVHLMAYSQATLDRSFGALSHPAGGI